KAPHRPSTGITTTTVPHLHRPSDTIKQFGRSSSSKLHRRPQPSLLLRLSLCDRSFQPPSGESSVATMTPLQASVNFTLFPRLGAVAF
ncbi:hypothetical protein PIB30_087226, partial [Stylosanthes scabra]|nr:hypothetical protein [Stylosanthes scabra]